MSRSSDSMDIQVEPDRIRLAPGVRIDLGGIGKGYAAERAAEILATAGPCLVNAGGDVATRGGAWPVGVETSGDAAHARAVRQQRPRHLAAATAAAGAATAASCTT